MDEVVTCKCGNQSWVLGTSGIRCSKCQHWLPKGLIEFSVDKANRAIKEGKVEENDPLVTVCNVCSRACCWQGLFMCELSTDAGVKEVRRSELALMGLEHSDYWKKG